MKLKTKRISYFLFSLSTVALSSLAVASVPIKHHHHHHCKHHHYKSELTYVAAPNYFEVIAAGSIAKLNAGNSRLGVTSNETDTLVQTNKNSWSTPGGQLGIGYVYNFCNIRKYCCNDVRWFTSVEPQLNIYQLSSDSIKGDVWRYGSANFNQLTFDIPISSTRLMLDGVVNIATWRQFSFYAKAGVGNVWNRASYSDQDNGSSSNCPNESVTLSSRTVSNFSWEAGLGAIVAADNRLSFSFEYLYADLGTVKTGGKGTAGAITAPVLSTPSFKLRTQTALVGIHFAI